MIDLLETLRESYDTNTLVAACAFAIGLFFGVIAEISRYCTRAAVAEWASPDPTGTGGNRTMAVLCAMLIALGGTQLLHATAVIDLSQTIYWSQTLKPVALVAGGALFGLGMVLAGGCISRLLVLAASGNGRSWVTLLVAGVAAYATLRGLLSYPRLWLESVWDTQYSTASLIGGSGMLVPAFAGWFLLALIGLTIKSKAANATAAVAGGAVGLTIILGWLATGVVGADDFEPVQLASLSFVAPVAESLQYLMIFTGDTIRFSIALVLGVLAGAFGSSLLGGRFGFTGFKDETSLLRYATGGLLMGFGGVTALGCTVGNGLSGVSAASPSSVLAIVSIVVAAAMTMRFRRSAATDHAPLAGSTHRA